MNDSYTHEELATLRRDLKEKLDRTEFENPGVRPLPPMGEDEAKDLLLDLTWTQTERVLTEAEGFLVGQLLAAYRMAIEARMLGRRGDRYFVVSETDLAKAAAATHASQSGWVEE